MSKLTFGLPDLKALRKEGFVADMHFHTRHSHDCRTPVKDIITRARKLGIWVAFTDHNNIGGVLEARKYKNAPVIPGVELCSKEGKEIIAYFYDDRKLEAFFNKRIAPELKEKNTLRSTRTPIRIDVLLSLLRKEECVVHIPHPFGLPPRRSYYFFNRPTRTDLLGLVDSIEVFNKNVVRRGNLSALGWAIQLGKGIAGGSDGHRLKWLGHGVTVSKAKTFRQHLDHIRKGRVQVNGVELKQHERAFDYTTGTVRIKIQRGVKDGIKKGLSLPKRALERL